LPHGRFYFAGTETDLEWRGYIEGALESAERQAAEIEKAFLKAK
jgi:monoamine oxidase